MKRGVSGYSSATGVTTATAGSEQMFAFYSNRVGCLGSLLISALLTALLILILL
jgi:hypothetical protein